ncbi:hypothetical protein [Georgenia yuyongxinii]|uniref:Uncharacterized protein n=1 Tax=Georgenia yuyongxinii TaxID=2589797 RepID=A0A552WU73_9MICO|nr:hypothetical protein [Georgenia yuyongxinii]TRW46400.1 hypothetical protein FJ693_05590 [Georgenia yuyongxinii]
MTTLTTVDDIVVLADETDVCVETLARWLRLGVTVADVRRLDATGALTETMRPWTNLAIACGVPVALIAVAAAFTHPNVMLKVTVRWVEGWRPSPPPGVPASPASRGHGPRVTAVSTGFGERLAG